MTTVPHCSFRAIFSLITLHINICFAKFHIILRSFPPTVSLPLRPLSHNYYAYSLLYTSSSNILRSTLTFHWSSIDNGNHNLKCSIPNPEKQFAWPNFRVGKYIKFLITHTVSFLIVITATNIHILLYT